MGDLSGRVALVTGSRQGIRAAIGPRLAAQGATVVINECSSLEGAEAVVARFALSGREVIDVPAYAPESQ